MLKNYFKIAWRNLLKDRQFTLLNLAGLSTGLACTFFIYIWVNDEWHVDKYNEKDSQLFQVMVNQQNEDGISTGTSTPGPLANAMAAEIPEIEDAATVLPASWFPNKGVISYGDAHFKAGGQFISKDYFNVFTCPYLDGDKNKVVSDKNSIAISDELAMKLFHTTSGLIGKTVEWDLQQFGGQYQISGIFEKLPDSATNQFDVLFNFDLFVEKREGMRSWNNSDPHTFVIVKSGTNVDQLNQKIKSFLKSKDKASRSDLFLIKYSDKYLYGQFENGLQSGGRIAYVRLFSIIAFFILVMACINFMNLSTAKAADRFKEVGIKKVMGAQRYTLILQYIGESLMLAFLALILAMGIIALFFPQFNQITGKQISVVFDIKILLVALVITIMTGIVAGSYPALYLSRYKPITALKGKFRSSLGELMIRKGLVVFQFSLSIIFIISVLIIYRQIDFIQTRDLGYNRDNLIHFEIPFQMDSVALQKAAAFLEEVKNIPGVVSATSYYHNLTGDHGSTGDFQWPGKNPDKEVEFANLEVGYNFMETLGIQIKEGRRFSQNANSQREIIFNEAAIQSMGLKDPIGKIVKFWGQERQIVGVSKNFNFESLYKSVKPCFFQTYPVMPNIMAKIKGGTEKQTIARIQKVFQDHNRGIPFDYQFLDENYRALYASEIRIGKLSSLFAGLATLISCLGLFGLAAFTARKRQKEIGVRKVIGASVGQITTMLSKDFIILVLIAIIIAFPLSWWAMHLWLKSFAYRIQIGAVVFLVAAGSIIMITLITISYQAIKAAIANPVKSLRTE